MSAESPDTPRPLGEISQAPAAFEQFLDRNQKRLMVAGLLLAVGVAGVVVYRGVQKGNQEAAGRSLQGAEDLSALQAVLRDFPGTEAAGSAQVLLGNQQWEEGQQDAAIETLRGFLAAEPEHPARHTARASLGSKLASQGKVEDARKVFEDLIEDREGEYLAPFALIWLGDLARAAGDTAAAEGYYQQVNRDYPGNSFNQIATTRVQLLKAKPPVEIDPPPVPEPEPAADPLAPPPFLTPNVPSGESGLEPSLPEFPEGDTPPGSETPEMPVPSENVDAAPVDSGAAPGDAMEEPEASPAAEAPEDEAPVDPAEDVPTEESPADSSKDPAPESEAPADTEPGAPESPSEPELSEPAQP
jgi:predicted negative regulator of RcsB-dependent stress response